MTAYTSRHALVVAVALLLAACGGLRTARTHARDPSGTPGNRGGDAGACVPVAIHAGVPPVWTASAWSDSSPGFTVPYALASGDAAAAFFFAPALRAGHPSNPTNKVLWVVRFRRDGHPLLITAQPSSNPSLVVRISRPADSSPGEIYPSYVDLPKPGCWRLALAWGAHRASIDVRVQPGSR